MKEALEDKVEEVLVNDRIVDCQSTVCLPTWSASHRSQAVASSAEAHSSATRQCKGEKEDKKRRERRKRRKRPERKNKRKKGGRVEKEKGRKV